VCVYVCVCVCFFEFSFIPSVVAVWLGYDVIVCVFSEHPLHVIKKHRDPQLVAAAL
jgi:hypothetical protein